MQTKIFAGEPGKKRSVKDFGCIWEDNVEVDLR
jgi:hypothetical protein